MLHIISSIKIYYTVLTMCFIFMRRQTILPPYIWILYPYTRNERGVKQAVIVFHHRLLIIVGSVIYIYTWFSWRNLVYIHAFIKELLQNKKQHSFFCICMSFQCYIFCIICRMGSVVFCLTYQNNLQIFLHTECNNHSIALFLCICARGFVRGQRIFFIVNVNEMYLFCICKFM